MKKQWIDLTTLLYEDNAGCHIKKNAPWCSNDVKLATVIIPELLHPLLRGIRFQPLPVSIASKLMDPYHKFKCFQLELAKKNQET